MPKSKPKAKAKGKRIRQQGTGSIFYNAKKDRWQATIELGVTADGRRIRKTRTERTQEDAETWLAQARADAVNGTIKPPSRETVRGYLEEWAATKAALTWGDRTAQEVPSKLALYVYPVIGTVRLNDLDAGHIRRVLATMARTVSKRTKRTLSKQTMLHVHRILHAALGRRIDWDEVESPSVKRRPAHLPEPEAVSDLLGDAAGAETPYGLVFVVMGMTGARPGEVLGLRRSDLDFARNTITIHEAMVTRGASKGTYKEPKTEESRRTVELPAEVMALLRAYCDDRAALILRAGRVFCTNEGGPLSIDRLYPVWRRLLRKRGIPYFRPYDLRHFAASFWLDEGVPLATVSAALGHSTQATTARVYSHKLRRSESRIPATSGKLLRLGKQEREEQA